MRKNLRIAAAVATVCVLTTGCNALDKLTGDKNPTSPSPSTVSLDVFAGTWASSSASTPPTTATEEAGGGIKVSYAGTVCGIPVSGSEVVKKP
jgi:hypothetical protein